jgi:hypothetical protein
MKINRLRFIGLCGLLFILSGCAGQNAYSINMYYDAEHAVIPEYLTPDVKSFDTAVSVAEFTDIRQVEEKLVIGHVVEDDGTKVSVFPKNIKATRSVSSGIKNYLKKAGYQVAERIEQWDLKEENIPPGDSKVLIGGDIEELEITCRRNFPTSSYKSNIKLNIVFADMDKGRILYKTTVESIYSREHVLFSENILGEQADIVLADAIEKLFEDKNEAQKLKQSIAR